MKHSVTTGSLLHRVLGTSSLQVNTAHNESVKTVPDGLIVNAVADDGIIAGFDYDLSFSLRH